MPLYMLQCAYTSEAWAAMVKNPSDRNTPVKALAGKLGGKMLHFYHCFGDYDAVIIFESPDETAASAAVLAAISAGHLKNTRDDPAADHRAVDGGDA